MKIDVGLRERAFVMVNGRAERYLGPGRHWVFRPFSRVEVERVSAACLLGDLDAEQLALVPPEDLQLLTVAPHQRALVLRHGKPVMWLGPGQHQVWTLERTLVGRGSVEQVARPAVAVEGVDTSGIEAPPLRDDVRPLVPATDYVEATAPEGSVVLRYVDGVLEAVLPAGRHAAWTTTRKVLLSVVDLRERLLHVTGQEVMTKDRVSLRLNLSAGTDGQGARGEPAPRAPQGAGGLQGPGRQGGPAPRGAGPGRRSHVAAGQGRHVASASCAHSPSSFSCSSAP